MLNFKPIVYYNVINQVISFWPRDESEVCCIGPTCPPCLYGSEKKQEMTSMLLELIGRVASVLAKLCLYWPSCSVSAVCLI